MKKGLFISFEGVDSSGKKTQAEMLVAALRKKDLEVEFLSFPAYDTPFGKIVGSFLRGEFYSLKNTIPEIASLLYAIDRYQFRNSIKQKLKEGKIIISNRFTQSAMAFEGTLLEGKEKNEFIKWVERVESRLPQPDLIFFVDMPIEASRKLIERREEKKYLQGKRKDILEENLDFQNAVRKTYLEMARRDKRWKIIKCVDRKENKLQLRTPEEIHKDVLKIIETI